jgi:hypothetical protein
LRVVRRLKIVQIYLPTHGICEGRRALRLCQWLGLRQLGLGVGLFLLLLGRIKVF